jgi:hypothetical protein
MSHELGAPGGQVGPPGRPHLAPSTGVNQGQIAAQQLDEHRAMVEGAVSDESAHHQGSVQDRSARLHLDAQGDGHHERGREDEAHEGRRDQRGGAASLHVRVTPSRRVPYPCPAVWVRITRFKNRTASSARTTRDRYRDRAPGWA